MTAPVIRPGRSGDQAYIASTWVDSVASARGNARNVGRSRYKRIIDPQVDRLLDREDTKVRVATVGDRIVGWICYLPIPRDVLVVHYIYVRAAQRGEGVGRALLAAASDGLMLSRSLCYTHRGPAEHHLLASANPTYASATFVTPETFP